MKKTELKKIVKKLVIDNVIYANSINNLITILKLKRGGALHSLIKQIINEEKIDISHFGKKIIKERKYREIKKNCPICNNEFIAKEGHKKEQKYCSKSCSNVDRIVSDETIQKIRTGVIKSNKLFKLVEKYGENIIGTAKEMKLNGKNYEEIRKNTNITEDDLKIFFNITNLNFSSNHINAYHLNKDEVLKLYLECKSLKQVAKTLNTSFETVRSFIDDDEIINKKITISKSQSVIDWRKRTKIKLVEYKGGKCECCNYNKSISVLQFHHIDSKEKDFNIGGRSYSFERLKAEVDKCIMVCANCHIEIHDEIRNFGYSEKVNNIKVLKFVL